MRRSRSTPWGVIAAAAFLTGCQDSPPPKDGGGPAPPAAPVVDFTKPGDDGGKLAGDATRGVQYADGQETLQPIPAPPACGASYQVQAVVRDSTVACEGINYAPYYRRAEAIADARIAELRCPDGCKPTHSWVVARKWDCLELGDEKTVLAGVIKSAKCPKEGDEKPAGLAAVADGAFAAPLADPADPQSEDMVNEKIVEVVGSALELGCPSFEVVKLEYSRRVRGCGPGFDFKPHVDRAVDRAKFHHASLRCQDGCEKRPFKLLRREWRCDADVKNVFVDVFYETSCERKPG